MESLAPFWTGLGWTLLLFVAGALVAAVCAFAAGLARLSHDRIVRGTARTYIEIFRGTSLLVQLYWFFFALPLLGLNLPKMLIALLVPGIHVGAYGAEVVRKAIQSVPSGQIEASIALNLTPRQRMRHVVLPQAIVGMLPTFGNLLIELLKATALVSMIFITELTQAALFVRDHTGSAAGALGLALVLYFLISLLVSWGIRTTERRLTRRWRPDTRN